MCAINIMASNKQYFILQLYVKQRAYNMTNIVSDIFNNVYKYILHNILYNLYVYYKKNSKIKY